MSDLDYTIEGLQQAQMANERAIAAMRPSGSLGRAVQQGTAAAHRYAVSITHVDTGALRASHRMEVKETRGEIFLDRNARNPRTGARVIDYGPEEHARGGEHAFYERTEREAGPRIAAMAIQIVTEGL